MRKSFLFYPNWCRVNCSFPQEQETSQVTDNRAAVAAYPEPESAVLCGTSRALRGAHCYANGLPRPNAGSFMEHNFYGLDPILPIATEVGFSEVPFLEAVSPSMRAVEAVIRELGHSSVPVLLIGERGTGKQTIAQRIHQNSGRSQEQFRVMSCQGLNFETLQSEASLSGATLYLDEICDLSPECQKQLLELLSSPDTNDSAGDKRMSVGISIRMMGGSSRDLEADVRAGSFQEDLYYRLSGVCLRIPPLRQRKEDIPQLMWFFLGRYAEAFRRPAPVLSAPTEQLFRDHSWPGNLRELEATARAIVAVGDESVAMGGLRSLLLRADSRQSGEKISLKEVSRAASREAEKELILKALTRTRWNRRRAAQDLQISYKALLYKLKQIGYGEYRAT
jgi:two-component system response regulator AtoC